MLARPAAVEASISFDQRITALPSISIPRLPARPVNWVYSPGVIGTWLSPFPKPPAKRVWGHWLYAGKAKLIDGKKYIGVLNSWGIDTGEKGWQWIGEDYFKSGHVWYGWTQVFDPSSIDAGFKHTFKEQMDLGSIGAEVIALQTALKIDGEFPEYVPATGLFGLITKDAVKKFQKKYGIEQAGRVGPKTLAQLNKLFS